MKNIFRHSVVVLALMAVLVACEELVDYTTVIDGADTLVYSTTGSSDVLTAIILHRPTGSTCTFTSSFPLRCNNSNHEATKVSLVYDESLVATYNAGNGTDYEALPEEYIVIENPALTLPANAVVTTDSVTVSISETADLSVLTEKAYVAAFSVVSADESIGTSKSLGAVFLVVDTEVNLFRSISGTDDFVGFTANTSTWTADCSSYENLFDGSTSTYTSLSSSGNELIVDMKETLMITGLRIRTYKFSNFAVDYSVDGVNWSEAGSPTSESGLYYFNGSSYSAGYFCCAVYDYIEARYLRLSFDYSSTARMYEIEAYLIESSEPTIYTETGSNNVVTGTVSHRLSSDDWTQSLSASFYVYATISSASGYTVSITQDNSYVDSYNSTYGTAYTVLPSSNLSLNTASLSIEAGENKSSDQVVVSLTGNLSALNPGTYLAPLKLSASGAVTSGQKGIVYVVVEVVENDFAPTSSASDIKGWPAGGISSWTVDPSDYSGLLEQGTTSAYRVNLASDPSFTIDMGSVHYVTGFHLYTYQISSLTFKYSTDGLNWISAGTNESGDYTGPTSRYTPGDYYTGLYQPVEARYLSFDVGFGYSSYSYIYYVDVYEVDSMEPTVYTVCGTDNTFTGTITHHTTAGTFTSLSDASFTVSATESSTGGYTVGAEQDNSLVTAYNSAHGTSYSEMPTGNVVISGSPVTIAAGATVSTSTISISLTGDCSSLTSSGGYLIPVQLTCSDAAVSSSRGVVYVVLDVVNSSDPFMKNFSVEDIKGTVVEDRSGWSIIACDESGIYSGDYANLLDGDTTSYIRTWGGPVSFTLDLGQSYDMTGLILTQRTDNSSYSGYLPYEIQIEWSSDNDEWYDMGTPSTSAGDLLTSKPSAYVCLYESQAVRYLRINAAFNSNMGTSEFNIYTE